MDKWSRIPPLGEEQAKLSLYTEVPRKIDSTNFASYGVLDYGGYEKVLVGSEPCFYLWPCKQASEKISVYELG
jgi:hypothetical protein